MGNPLYDTLFGQHVGSSAVFLQLEDGASVTYADFLEMAARYAGLLGKLGLNSGDRVAAQIAKSPQALAVYAACAQAGLVFLPLNTAYTATEVSYFVEDSGARILLCDQENSEALTLIADANGVTLETINEDGSGTFCTKAEDLSKIFEICSTK